MWRRKGMRRGGSCRWRTEVKEQKKEKRDVSKENQRKRTNSSSLLSSTLPPSSATCPRLHLFPSLSSCFCLVIVTHLPPSSPDSSPPPSRPPLWFCFQKPPKLLRPPAASVCLYINNSRWQTAAFSSLTCQPEAWHAHFLISFHFPFSFVERAVASTGRCQLSVPAVGWDKYSSPSGKIRQRRILGNKTWTAAKTKNRNQQITVMK